MNSKTNLSKVMILVAIAIVVIVLALIIYKKSQPTPMEDDLLVPPTRDESINNDEVSTLYTVPDEAESSVDTSAWVRVPEDGYEFWHPDYFIKQENDYYIIAPDPLQGAEFSGVALHKPFEIPDIEAYLQETIENKDASVGINVTREPERISSNGLDTVYVYEFELESGYNTGPGKFFAFKSPYADEWVTIEYAVNPNAEAIRESFRFMPTQ